MTFADIQNGIAECRASFARIDAAHSAQVAALQKELDLTKRLLALEEALRIRLQLEVDERRAAAIQEIGNVLRKSSPAGNWFGKGDPDA